ncbi:hypothetical protein [Caldalkalibacillus salinus]|nr:hypothetical protein [Caldalkalibacillus salinus]
MVDFFYYQSQQSADEVVDFNWTRTCFASTWSRWSRIITGQNVVVDGGLA